MIDKSLVMYWLNLLRQSRVIQKRAIIDGDVFNAYCFIYGYGLPKIEISCENGTIILENTVLHNYSLTQSYHQRRAFFCIRLFRVTIALFCGEEDISSHFRCD